MEQIQCETKFLPAERSTEGDLLRLRNKLMRQPLVLLVMNGLPDGAVMINAARQIVLANSAFVQITGRISEDEVLGLRPGEAVGCVHTVETRGCGTTEFCRHCGAAQVLQQCLLDQTAVEECRITTRAENGTLALDLLVWGTPISVDGDDYIFFTIRDISHEKRRRILERVFFHDLLNTTGALSGLSKLLLKKAPQDLVNLIQPISQATGTLLNEIEAQKQIYDAENDDLQITPVVIRTREYLSGLVDMFAGHRHSHGIGVELASDSEDLELAMDQVLLNRIMCNLVNNAMEASGSGMAVTASCRRVGDRVEFSVHNQDYMPREVQLQVFKRSFSTKGPGRGLGLYSVKLITERYLGGRVGYASSPETGTKFYVALPFDRPD